LHGPLQVIAAWQYEYNHLRPHSSLNYLTPAEFARQQPAVAGLESQRYDLKQDLWLVLLFYRIGS
jgi:hypothetical protein